MPRHFLIIDARFYADLADELVRGATAELERRGATYERISVPGVLEIPAALAMALKAQRTEARATTVTCCSAASSAARPRITTSSPNESARAVMDLAASRGARASATAS